MAANLIRPNIMKRKFLFAGVITVILAITGFIAIYIWIDLDVRKNILIAREKYPGNAEDALIEYLLDTLNSHHDRTHIAIWTLGQIKSNKALPLLQGLYMNDPDGKTCYGKHDTVLCQYEIYKAIKAVESNWWPLHGRLKR
jgi:hypothetical protein